MGAPQTLRGFFSLVACSSGLFTFALAAERLTLNFNRGGRFIKRDPAGAAPAFDDRA